VAEDRVVTIVTGCYGSGKTEYAVNLAASVNEKGTPCTLVDLDVVNPYFRSRDVREAFSREGIEVVAPTGAFAHADLPMLPPRIQGVLSQREREVILDVGGDPAGAKVLGRFARQIKSRRYSMVFVVNTRRPSTRESEAIVRMMEGIEARARVPVTDLVANTHLMEETTEALINEGIRITRKVAAERGLGFVGACVLEDYLPRLDTSRIEAEVLVLKKYMRKPWERGVPAARRN